MTSKTNVTPLPSTSVLIYAHGSPLYYSTWGKLKEVYPMLEDDDFQQLLSDGCDRRIWLEGDAYIALPTVH